MDLRIGSFAVQVFFFLFPQSSGSECRTVLFAALLTSFWDYVRICDKGEGGCGLFECCVVIKFQFPLIFLCQVRVRVVLYIVLLLFYFVFSPITQILES